jgi:cell division protease FtsH
MHVIYPTLSKEAFKIIIGRRVSSIIQRVYQQTGIRVLVNQSVNDVIYRNGVFPTQGTRPLFSTISEALESVLPKLIFTALKLNKNEIILSFKDNKLVGRIGNVVKTSKYYGSLDKIKHSRNLNVNRKTLAAVHEAAHAIIHAILFKVSPNQIVSTPVSAEMEGFVYSQENCHSKDMLHKRLRVTLAGQQAEIMVFGENNKTSGGEEDLKKATSIAAAMVRKWGMDANFSSFYGNIYSEKANSVNNDIEKTNSSIENLIRNASEETFSLLSKNSALLIEVVDQLMVADKLEPEEFKKICSKYGLTISISKASEEVLYWNFYEKLNEFKNKNLKNKNANIP